jgi:cellulose synthase/poly-beta-1,6-N-acetylglucosamine synthase-like glycosyltransferase
MQEVIYWSAVAVVVYCYVGYPLLAWAFAAACARGWSRGRFDGSVSIVIAARNERANIVRRVRELAAQLVDAVGPRGQIIVVSDGSTDDTERAAQVRGLSTALRVIALPDPCGKAAAISVGAAAAEGDVLVLADCRQSWAPDALRRLLENFADPAVGAASGELVVEAPRGAVNGVGLYWRFEKWLRRTESRLHSTVGVSGSICAVRRELFAPVPAGTVLDDVYWPLRVVMGGRRVVHDARAVAYDRLPARARDEFRRKVRTLSGNFQLLARLPSALLPWRNRVWLQLVSHKVLRLIVPWAMIVVLVLGVRLRGWPYAAGACAVAALGAAALAGAVRPVSSRFRPAGAAAAFVLLNAAAWLAFWVWLAGRSAGSWSKVSYPAREGTA